MIMKIYMNYGCLVQEDKECGKIIGNILAGNDGRRGYIYHTAVNPMYRKQGIAAALVNTALEALRNMGIHKIALVVFEKNETGNKFWEKMGFTENLLVFSFIMVHNE